MNVKYSLLFLLINAFYTLSAQPPAGSWSLLFEDNFEGTELDRSKWTPEYPWGREHNYDAFLSPENVIVQDGLVTLKAEKKPNRGFNYTSGVISGHNKFPNTYGYYEARIKMMAGKVTEKRGWWAAWWLSCSDSWPPEIDICEYFKNGQTFKFNNIWRDKSNQVHYDVFDTPNFTDDVFHVYGMLWTKDTLQLYMDGKAVPGGIHKTNIPASDLFMILNFGVEKSETWGNPDPYLPTTVQCDYIRVYTKTQIKPEIPEVVSNLNVNPYDGFVAISWDSTANATSYQIYRKSGEENYTFIGERSHLFEYIDFTSQSGINYQYQVVASNYAGRSVPSESEVISVPSANDVIWIDDSNDSCILFSDDFRNFPDPEAYLGTIRRSNWLKDGFVSFYFEGTGFEIFGSKFSYCKTYDVEIDGVIQNDWKGLVSNSNIFERKVSVFNCPLLSEGVHKVTLYVRNGLFELDLIRINGKALLARDYEPNYIKTIHPKQELSYVRTHDAICFSNLVTGSLYSVSGAKIYTVFNTNEIKINALKTGIYLFVSDDYQPLKIQLN